MKCCTFLALIASFFLFLQTDIQAQQIVVPDSQSIFKSYSGMGWYLIRDSAFVTTDSLVTRIPTEFGLGTNDSAVLVAEVCDSSLCHRTYQQYHKEYPITNCFFSVHSRNDTVRLMNGTAYGNLDLPTEIDLDADSAITLAITFLNDTSLTFAWQDSALENTARKLLGDTTFTYYPDTALLTFYRTSTLYDQNDSVLYKGDFILCYLVKVISSNPYTEHTI